MTPIFDNYWSPMNQQATLKNLKIKVLLELEKVQKLTLHQYISDEMLFDVRSPSDFSNTQLGTNLFEFVLACRSAYKINQKCTEFFIESSMQRFLGKSDDYLLTPVVFQEKDEGEESTGHENIPQLNKIEFVLWLMCVGRIPVFKVMDRIEKAEKSLVDFDKILLYQHYQGEQREITLKNAPYYWNHYHHHTFLSPACMLGVGDLSTKIDENPYYKKTIARKRLCPIEQLNAVNYVFRVLNHLNRKIDKVVLINCIEDALLHDKLHSKEDSNKPWHGLNTMQAFHFLTSKKEMRSNPNLDIDNDVWVETIQALKKHQSSNYYSAYDSCGYFNFVLFFYLYVSTDRGQDLILNENNEKLRMDLTHLIHFYHFSRESRYPIDRLGKDFVNCLSEKIVTRQEKLKSWFDDCAKWCLKERLNQYHLGIVTSLSGLCEEDQKAVIEKALHEKVYSIPLNKNGLYEYQLDKIQQEEPEEESGVYIQMIEADGFVKLKKRVEEMKKDSRNDFTNLCNLHERLKEQVPNGEQEGCRKKLATLDSVTQEKINFLKEMFPHMHEVTEFIFEQMQLSRIGNKSIQFPPILLNGPAGTGKTFFFKVFSDILELDLSLINGPSINASWAISGLEPSWGGACPGLIYKTLMESNIANPIILLDEMDKIRSGNEKSEPVEDVLLNLFEKHSASQFRDMFVPDLKIDASNIIWVCTSNNVNQITDPMKSRLKIFEIPMPDRNALKRLGMNVYRNLKKSNPWGDFFDQEIPEETLELLVDNDNSVRDMRKCIEFAFARAANENSTKILPHHLNIEITLEHHLPWHRKLRS